MRKLHFIIVEFETNQESAFLFGQWTVPWSSVLGVLQLPPTGDGHLSWESPAAQHCDIPGFQTAKSKTLPRSVRRCKSRRLQCTVLRDGAGGTSTVSRGDTETSFPGGEGTQHGRGREAPLEQFLVSGSRNATQISFRRWAVGICFLILSSALWDKRLRSAVPGSLNRGQASCPASHLRSFCSAARLPSCPTPGAVPQARSAPRCVLFGAVTPGGILPCPNSFEGNAACPWGKRLLQAERLLGICGCHLAISKTGERK